MSDIDIQRVEPATGFDVVQLQALDELAELRSLTLNVRAVGYLVVRPLLTRVAQIPRYGE